MTRRDTIIITVLLNAGLLIVLFTTSLKTDKNDQPTSSVQILASSHPEKEKVPNLVQELAVVKPIESMDPIIPQYSAPLLKTVNPTAPAETNFLADLEALGTKVKSEENDIEIRIVKAPESQVKEVTVKQGDVLERIARQHNVSVSQLMEFNRLATTRLKIGQVLKIPNASSQSKKSQLSSQNDAKYYTVKSGDSPWTIAIKHQIKVEELLKLNDMSPEKAKHLRPGEQLRIQ